MQPPFNDKWERKKRYLLRNLLVEPGFRLSPVPEERSSEGAEERPDSPLPDLIVERVPKRREDDETEDFYQELEWKMKKLHKILFIDNQEVESSNGELSSPEKLSPEEHYITEINEECDPTTKEDEEINLHDENSEESPDLDFEWLMNTSELSETFDRHNNTASVTNGDKSIDNWHDEFVNCEDELITNDNQTIDKDHDGFDNCEEPLIISQTNVIQSLDKDYEEFDNSQEELIVTQDSVVSKTALLENIQQTIGPDEYPHTRTETELVLEENPESDEDSFEKALRKSVFERKHKRKTYCSSDEESDFNNNETEESEIIETMRGSKPSSVNDSFRRKASSTSQENTTYLIAENASAEKIEETEDCNDDDINVSVEITSDESLLVESAQGEDITDVDVSAISETAEKSNIFNESSQSDAYELPSIQINAEEFSSKDDVSPTIGIKHFREVKSRNVVVTGGFASKRRKYNSIAIQTSPPASQRLGKSWDEIKSNFFVGTPLVYRLCSCQDHNCS